MKTRPAIPGEHCQDLNCECQEEPMRQGETMFLVGGGILVHGLPFLHHGVAHSADSANGISNPLIIQCTNALVGVLAGVRIIGLE